ncbi:class I SAM-dependent methyltransferase [bacterium]|nr:class I SAM-dependent methyltransferase [bacterium]
MGRLRRFYYDIFSHFYDLIIQMHSKDEGSNLRDFLIEKTGIRPWCKMLDICTGTGSVALAACKAAGPKGLVVGLDFSYGMLMKARDKASGKGLCLIAADVALMPFKANAFDCVTCSHAMYELKSKVRTGALEEIKRVLKEGRRFFMMEHCKPKNPVIKIFYYIRLMSMGSTENRVFAHDEFPFLKVHFDDIKKELSPSGKSKLIYGMKGSH